MRFNLELTDKINNERIFVNLLSRQPHSFGTIRAIMDTGSPTTVISLRDAIKLSIPLNNSDKADPICGFGKGGIPSKKLNNYTLALNSTDNKIKIIKMPLLVADKTEIMKLDQNLRERTFQIPTIIGLDFLRESGLKLFVDLKNKISFFED